MDNIEDTRRKLRFRSWHRGTREMDLLLGSFADSYLPTCDANDLAVYEEFLKENDPDIYDWYIERSVAPNNINHTLLKKFKSHTYARNN